MNQEDELARQLEHELGAALASRASGAAEQATPAYNLPPEVRRRLETAAGLAQVDFSQGSPLRPALRARLAVQARKTLPGAFRRAKLARRLQPALAVAGLVVLVALLVFGVSLAINHLRPVPATNPPGPVIAATGSPTAEPPPPTALPSQPPPATPAPSAIPPAASDEKHLALESGLQVEEFALTGAPELDPLKLTLRSGGQPEVFFLPSTHLMPPASEINASGQMVMTTTLNGEKLSAVLFEASRTTNADGSVSLQEAVQVMLGDQVIYTTQPSDASPITILRGLWAYDGHWVLEIAHVTNSVQPDNGISSFVTGHIIQDGVLLNESLGYQEAFGFQPINGLPFYFFKRGGQIGVVYNGQETQLGYDDVPHYGCCSAAELNSRQYAGGVTFIASRRGTYYYVAIGASSASSEAEQAQATVSQFLADLAGGQDDPALYDAAVQLYGGGWAELQSAYPDAAGDHFTLFQQACAPGGMYFCLKVRQLSPAEKLAEGRYRLWAQFSRADGTLWAAKNNGQSWFDFEVIRGPGGQWMVMDPPPTDLGFRRIVAHLSIAETAGLDHAGVLRALWEDYMQRCQFTLLDDHQRLVEYALADIQEAASLDSLRQEQGLDMLGTVAFSVRPPAMQFSDWIAGNGEVQGDWVRNKFLFIGAIQDSAAVHLRIIGTGP
jgi:hypothetical protein